MCVNDAYLTIARELKAKVAPAGIAWQLALEQRPGLLLHKKDMSHPTLAGSYLTACVFYSVLYGRTPQGLPGSLFIVTKSGRKKTLAKLTPTDALFLQGIAWEAVQRVERLRKRR